MGKGIALGVVIGALVAAGLFKVVESRRGGGADKPAAGAAAGNAASPNPEAEALKKEIAGLNEEAATLQADLKAADEKLAAVKAGGKLAAKNGSRNPWADLGARMYKLRAKLDDNDEGMDAEVQELWVDLINIAKKLTEEYGMGMDEFELSPWGLPMMLLAILDGSDTKPDAGQKGKFEKLMEDTEAGWKELMARKGELTDLEQKREMARLSWGAMDEIRGSLTPEQTAALKEIKFLNRETRFPAHYYAGTRESVASNILSDWQKGLKLDDVSSTALKPVVDDYLRSYQAMEDEFKRREAAGQTIGSTERAMAQADLIIAAQKRVSETVRLTDEQMKQLRNWDHAYNVTIVEGGGGLVPPEDD